MLATQGITADVVFSVVKGALSICDERRVIRDFQADKDFTGAYHVLPSASPQAAWSQSPSWVQIHACSRSHESHAMSVFSGDEGDKGGLRRSRISHMSHIPCAFTEVQSEEDEELFVGHHADRVHIRIDMLGAGVFSLFLMILCLARK